MRQAGARNHSIASAAGQKSLSEAAQGAPEMLEKSSDRADSPKLGAFPSSTAIARQSPKLRRA